MKSSDIRKLWLEYFSSKRDHLTVASASLVPQNPTLLLTNAGMVPFVPYFLGTEQAPSKRIVSVQRCVRVGGKDSDLENIGRTPRHLSFFEMLGNFSFGDYFKEEAITWAWELLTGVYGFAEDDLMVSVFAGDEKTPPDDEARLIWHKKIGLPEQRIVAMGRKDNFWGPPGGVSGPCGPCSEIYYAPCGCQEPLEIWNLVFMQYEQLNDGSLTDLSKPNIDTGAGLERLASILQSKPNVHQTDLFEPLMLKIKALALSNPARNKSTDCEVACKIIADHLRCSAMLCADGIVPSNLGRGYILRMLIRRAGRYGWTLGLNRPFLNDIVPTLVETFAGTYPELSSNCESIVQTISQEEEAFLRNLEQGEKRFAEVISKHSGIKIISGEQAFDLHATYGLPIEITQDMAAERDLSIDLEGFELAMQNHSKISGRSQKFAVAQSSTSVEIGSLPKTEFLGYEMLNATDCTILSVGRVANSDDFQIILDKTPFYAESGGQAADLGILGGCFSVTDVQKQGSVHLHRGTYLDERRLKVADKIEAVVDSTRRAGLRQHHTATHLIQAALRKIVGKTIQQAGSSVQPDSLRFDFTHNKALSQEELQGLEVLINEWIAEDFVVQTLLMSYEEAIDHGALAFFADKYDSSVRVLSIGHKSKEPISVELCGGTHVSRTGQILVFKIDSESALASGIRRIEASCGSSALNKLFRTRNTMQKLSNSLKTNEDELAMRISELQSQQKKLEKKLKTYQDKELSRLAEQIASRAENAVWGDLQAKIAMAQVEDSAAKTLTENIASKLSGEHLVFILGASDGRPVYCAKVSAGIPDVLTARKLIQLFNDHVGGSGGGNDRFAQGGGGDPNKVKQALKAVKQLIELTHI